MKNFIILTIYHLLLSLLFFAVFPRWVVKMLKRNGVGSKLSERVGLYLHAADYEPHGAIHVHAISVGETILGLKLIRQWQQAYPNERFVLATGTATGHQTALSADLKNVHVTYSPLDFPWMVKSYLNRFEPRLIILIEGEIWPNLLRHSEKRHIAVTLANARTSPRSARRMRKFSPILKPFFSKLSAVCIQEENDKILWQKLGVAENHIHLTGSIKFDSTSNRQISPRNEFSTMLNTFGKNRKIVLVASTFPGEELFISQAILKADPEYLPVIVPRHAERRSEVRQTLQKAGHAVALRSEFSQNISGKEIFVIDSTGELAEWTMLADIVIIGKSFLEHGGQNPAEAIAAEKPLIFGKNMQNFEPLSTCLREGNGAICAKNQQELIQAINSAMDSATAKQLTQNATRILSSHNGATQRHLKVLHPLAKPA